MLNSWHIKQRVRKLVSLCKYCSFNLSPQVSPRQSRSTVGRWSCGGDRWGYLTNRAVQMKTQHWETWHCTKSVSLGEKLSPVTDCVRSQPDALLRAASPACAVLGENSKAVPGAAEPAWPGSGQGLRGQESPWWPSPGWLHTHPVLRTCPRRVKYRAGSDPTALSILWVCCPRENLGMFLACWSTIKEAPQQPLEYITHTVRAVLSFPVFLPFRVAVFQS